jgi:hypothetical protein
VLAWSFTLGQPAPCPPSSFLCFIAFAQLFGERQDMRRWGLTIITRSDLGVFRSLCLSVLSLHAFLGQTEGTGTVFDVLNDATPFVVWAFWLRGCFTKASVAWLVRASNHHSTPPIRRDSARTPTNTQPSPPLPGPRAGKEACGEALSERESRFLSVVTTLHACPPCLLCPSLTLSHFKHGGVCGSRPCTLTRSPTHAPTIYPHILHSYTTQLVHFLARPEQSKRREARTSRPSPYPGKEGAAAAAARQAPSQQPWSAFCTSSARCSASSPRWQRQWTGRSRSVRRSCGRS